MAKIRTLRLCPLFRRLGYKDLAILAPHVQEEAVKKDHWIAEEGSPTDGLIIIKKGKVRLSLGNLAAAQIDLGPAEFFGELSLVEGSQIRAVNAKALEPTEYLKIQLTDYQQLIDQAPEVATRISIGILQALKEKMELTKDLLSELVQVA